VIHLSRLNGQGFVLNPDLILKAESTPDTVVTLVDGTKFVVLEPLDVLSDRVVHYRAQVVATARELPGSGAAPAVPPLAVVEAPAGAGGTEDGHPALSLAPESSTRPGSALAEPVPLRRRRRS
jgi:flagellar protein FlbD